MLRAIAFALREIVALWPDFSARIVAVYRPPHEGHNIILPLVRGDGAEGAEGSLTRRVLAIMLPAMQLNYV
jgi:hypothetical protein